MTSTPNQADPPRAEEDLRSEGQQAQAEPRGQTRRRWIGLAAGVIGAVLVYVVLPDDLGHHGRVTAATAVLMALWWMTEAIPIPATALVPLIAFPVLVDDVDVDGVGASYGNNIIFLFMGGFLLALAMQRWNLHRRVALVTVRAIGTSPVRLVAGFMLATGFISMWVSNTATAVMMLPIGVSVLMLVTNLERREDGGSALAGDGDGTATASGDSEDPEEGGLAQAVVRSKFGTALMLGIAYAASIGSLATIIGTPPNALLVAYMSENHDVSIGFGQWMILGLPLAIIFMVLAWWLLTKVLFRPEIDRIPGGRELMTEELRKLGPMSQGEIRVLAIFLLAALSWVFVPIFFDPAPISDAGIAMAVGVLLFLLPAGAARGVRLLTWETAVKLPWGVLLLFGGGLALSSQFGASGLTEWIGDQVQALGAIPVVLLVALCAAGVLFLTELTSNTATAATFLPLAGGVALGLGLDPLLLAIPVAVAATCAFMLPVATPPNAIAFGSGYVTIMQMMRGGLWLNLAGIVIVTSLTMTVAVWVFGITY